MEFGGSFVSHGLIFKAVRYNWAENVGIFHTIPLSRPKTELSVLSQRARSAPEPHFEHPGPKWITMKANYLLVVLNGSHKANNSCAKNYFPMSIQMIHVF